MWLILELEPLAVTLSFFGAIAIRFPHIVHSTVVASEAGYDPLTLAGVVSEDGGTVTTTELPIAINFYTPYYTFEGISLHIQF